MEIVEIGGCESVMDWWSGIRFENVDYQFVWVAKGLSLVLLYYFKEIIKWWKDYFFFTIIFYEYFSEELLFNTMKMKFLLLTNCIMLFLILSYLRYNLIMWHFWHVVLLLEFYWKLFFLNCWFFTKIVNSFLFIFHVNRMDSWHNLIFNISFNRVSY